MTTTGSTTCPEVCLTRQRHTFRLVASLAATLLLAVAPAGAITYVHHFQPGPRTPTGGLVSDGTSFYGTTASGGFSDRGTVFRIKADGSDFTVLHEFAGNTSEGGRPLGPLVLTGGSLYGTTSGGGANYRGTVFKMSTDGSTFQTLHVFGLPPDGEGPGAGLTLHGTFLYGTTELGGAADLGTVFRIDTDGNNYSRLHEFVTGGSQGSSPMGLLAVSPTGIVFGTASGGGSGGIGTIFSWDSSSTPAFSVLHHFATGGASGANPEGGLLLVGTTLYGTTTNGGGSGLGSVFSFPAAGGSITMLHSFTGAADGQYPGASTLTSDGSTLYGVVAEGGSSGDGTIFSLPVGGGAITVLHHFVGDDGSSPRGRLLLESGNLYGITRWGGAPDEGVFFMVASGGGGFSAPYTFPGSSSDGSIPRAGLVADAAGYLYGTTSSHGLEANGGIFKVKTDGSEYTILHSFADDATNGYESYSPLVLDAAGNLYGTTCYGGQFGSGTIFAIMTDGTGFDILHSFAGDPVDGACPRGRLLLDGTILYGTTEYGGSGGDGTVFKLDLEPAVPTLSVLHSFASADGVNPTGGVILDGAGFLHGTTSYGGTGDHGTIYTIDTDGNNFSVLHRFASGVDDGSHPHGELVIDGSGDLYGTTAEGGAASGLGWGTVFRFTSGSGITLLHSFTSDPDGRFPHAGLVLAPGGWLYGTTDGGGASGGYGTVFALTTSGTDYQLLGSLASDPDGAFPQAALLLEGGTLYGVTTEGGTSGWGTVFSITSPVPVELQRFSVE